MPTGVYKHPNRKPVKERFWEKVIKTKGCWTWTAYTNKKGYGEIQIGRGIGVKLVHRISYEMKNGPIPKGLFVLHKCDNPPCVKPSHLFLGTLEDNNKDMVQKGRVAKGEQKKKSSKLKEADIKAIRALYKTNKFSQNKIAKMFGICGPHVCQIISKKCWSHID